MGIQVLHDSLFASHLPYPLFYYSYSADLIFIGVLYAKTLVPDDPSMAYEMGRKPQSMACRCSGVSDWHYLRFRRSFSNGVPRIEIAMSDATTQHAIDKIFEKLDDMATKQAEVGQRLEVHIAAETEWQKNTTDKLDTHINEHLAASTVWRKGVVGFLFMLLGTVTVWAVSFIVQHLTTGKAP
jgi:hypothetical protein